jgi:hypothetical protein
MSEKPVVFRIQEFRTTAQTSYGSMPWFVVTYGMDWRRQEVRLNFQEMREAHAYQFTTVEVNDIRTRFYPAIKSRFGANSWALAYRTRNTAFYEEFIHPGIIERGEYLAAFLEALQRRRDELEQSEWWPFLAGWVERRTELYRLYDDQCAPFLPDEITESDLCAQLSYLRRRAGKDGQVGPIHPSLLCESLRRMAHLF